MLTVKKLISSFGFRDLLPDISLEKLKNDLQTKVKADTDLSQEQRKTLDRLVGVNGAHGLLYKKVFSAETTELADQREIVLKTLFGGILANY